MNRKHPKKSLLLICAILLVLMSLLLSACQQDADDTPGLNDSDPPIGSTGAAGPLSFTFDGMEIVPGELFADISDALGPPEEVFDIPSPLFETADTIYYYSGFSINTYVDEDGAVRILSVVFDDDSVTTDKGAYLGMSKLEVTSLYGDGDEEPELPVITYRYGDIKLRFAFDESDYVIDITLSYAPIQDLYDELNDTTFADDHSDDQDEQAAGDAVDNP